MITRSLQQDFIVFLSEPKQSAQLKVNVTPHFNTTHQNATQMVKKQRFWFAQFAQIDENTSFYVNCFVTDSFNPPAEPAFGPTELTL